jgi:hypothetical protein
MPHTLGEKEAKTHFTVRVFQRIFYSNGVGDLRGVLERLAWTSKHRLSEELPRKQNLSKG